MLRVISLIALLCLSICAIAEEAGVDEVLKTSNGVSEEQLDRTAETLISQQESEQKLGAATAPATVKVAETAVAATTKEAKTQTESEIPVFKDERTGKATSQSPWMRLIGSAVFILLFAIAVFVAFKKIGKKKNIGGKKAKIELLHQHFLGPKKSLALIQVAGETILIGVTDHNINMIKPVALIDDEIDGQPQDFHGFLDDEFTVEHMTAQKSRSRVI